MKEEIKLKLDADGWYNVYFKDTYTDGSEYSDQTKYSNVATLNEVKEITLFHFENSSKSVAVTYWDDEGNCWGYER